MQVQAEMAAGVIDRELSRGSAAGGKSRGRKSGDRREGEQ
jgi:hypothetical protein